ncbi:MAG: hypothetical protein M3410_08215 [Acidobacteriota bacterium]|nr:hypothetical protein [Acidobacteriota bacterium]
MPENGLRAYGFHADEEREATRAIRSNIDVGKSADHFGLVGLTQPDLETVARQYSAGAFESEALPLLTTPNLEGQDCEFKLVGIDWSTEKSTHTAKFNQTLNGIPVYGSLVTVELDAANELIAINSAVGEPRGVSAVPNLRHRTQLLISSAELMAIKTVLNKPNRDYHTTSGDSFTLPKTSFVSHPLPVKYQQPRPCRSQTS